MGTALAVHSARNGADTVLLATGQDEAVVDAWRQGLREYPASWIRAMSVAAQQQEWSEVMPGAAVVFVAVSSAGLQRVLSEASRIGAPDAIWVLATKGWAPARCRPPARSLRQCSGTCRWSRWPGPRWPPSCSPAHRPACSARPTTSRPAGAPLPPSPRRLRRCSPPATSPGPRPRQHSRMWWRSPSASPRACPSGSAKARLSQFRQRPRRRIRPRHARHAGARGGAGRPGSDRARAGGRRRPVRHLPARPQRPLRAAAGLGRHRQRRDPLDWQHRGGSSRTPQPRSSSPHRPTSTSPPRGSSISR